MRVEGLHRAGDWRKTVSVVCGPGASGRCPNHRREAGFSLVEVAIGLVVIGLLLGAILTSRELVGGARVRTLADSASDISTGYYGFVDRYGRVPGDWNAAAASAAIGVGVAGGGNDNGNLDNPPGPNAYDETNAMWEQLGAGGFIQGTYAGTAGLEPDAENGLAPLNVFNSVIAVGRTSDFEGASSPRLHVVFGRRVPVATMRELDLKLDDTAPETGDLRATKESPAVFAGAHQWGGREPDCVLLTADMKKSKKSEGNRWDVPKNAEDCNAVLLF